MVLIIVALAAIAVSLVHLRRDRIAVGHEVQRLRSEQVTLRRKMWDQQVRLGYLTAPREVRRRAEETSMNRTSVGRLASGDRSE